MIPKIQLIAGLAYIDNELRFLQEEFGDLPEQVEEKKKKVDQLKAVVDETENILKEIRDFVASAKITLVELKEKEEKLAKQQFMSRNNKEFDAITKEIEHLKQEHEKLATKMRTEGVKEENIMRILADQQKQYQEALQEFEKMQQEYEEISEQQSDEVKLLKNKRKLIVSMLPKDFYDEYNRVMQYHYDAAVQVKKNSCLGCYSAVPSQKVVELRNNLDKIYHCENCGRILIPEEIPFDESLLDIK
jgi:hypothetical protein